MTRGLGVIAAAQKEAQNETVSVSREGPRRRALRSSYWEGSLYSLMIATAEHFALIFAVSQNLSNAEIGILTTAPLLVGAFANLFIPGEVRQSALKKWLSVFVGLQILGVLGLLLVSLNPHERLFEALFVCLSLYWLGGLVASPLWIDWMSGWLPTERLGRFFSRRTAWISLTTLLCTLAAAATAKLMDASAAFFVLMFCIGLAARITALGFVILRANPPSGKRIPKVEHIGWHHLKEVLMSSPGAPVLIIVIAAVCLRFVAGISSPYFLPYMMRDLQFSPALVTVIQSVTYVSTFLFMSSYAESIRRYSLVTATQVAFYGVALTSLAWVWFSSPSAIATIQFFNGIFWSGMDLCLILWIQSTLPNSARRLMGIYVALCQMASVGGSLIGAELLKTYQFSNFDLIEISTGLRWLVAIGLTVALSTKLSRQTSFDQSRKFLIYLFMLNRLREGIRIRLSTWI